VCKSSIERMDGAPDHQGGRAEGLRREGKRAERKRLEDGRHGGCVCCPGGLANRGQAVAPNARPMQAHMQHKHSGACCDRVCPQTIEGGRQAGR